MAITRPTRERSFPRARLTYHVKWEPDGASDTQYLIDRATDLRCDDSREGREERKGVIRRIKDFKSGRLWFVSCTISVTYRDIVLTTASLSGVDSDAGDHYMRQVENDLIDKAEDQIKLLSDALLESLREYAGSKFVGKFRLTNSPEVAQN